MHWTKPQRVSDTAKNVKRIPEEDFNALNTDCSVFPLFSNFRKELLTFGTLLGYVDVGSTY